MVPGAARRMARRRKVGAVATSRCMPTTRPGASTRQCRRLTSRYIQAMVNDRFFWPALWTTFLLMVLIIPVQFVLAAIMALIIQQQLRGNSFFLYVFAIAWASPTWPSASSGMPSSRSMAISTASCKGWGSSARPLRT